MAGEPVSHTDEDVARETTVGAAPRYSRRLSDKILIAFHHACDQGDFEVAEQLLHILEMMLNSSASDPGWNAQAQHGEPGRRARATVAFAPP